METRGPKSNLCKLLCLSRTVLVTSNFDDDSIKHAAVFRRTWTDCEELLKEKSFFILSFVFLPEFVIRQVQTNIY